LENQQKIFCLRDQKTETTFGIKKKEKRDRGLRPCDPKSKTGRYLLGGKREQKRNQETISTKT
jgi:hypothetical protein